ncbi:helix-turn-helix domain-containing protein [Gluconobacter albidus]|uniref:helix-turn-helix domain-containing protein n=1 Tax=Gluconobacter albidus TaxID=318683 RepID=UPI001B8D6328|nr:helix-turn-helix transcriptional regulator [Gluconobacter albidus]MBS1028759.1 helix-turn-helix transcriptional regulator [Gluconobacter albidus]MCP1274783.1 helix-turn-helix domain-containing protein [Gluconobacter albidus]
MNASNEIRSADVFGAINRAIMSAGSQKDFAAKAGVSSAFVSRVMHGLSAPSPKLLKAAGLRRVVSVHFEFVENADV